MGHRRRGAVIVDVLSHNVLLDTGQDFIAPWKGMAVVILLMDSLEADSFINSVVHYYNVAAEERMGSHQYCVGHLSKPISSTRLQLAFRSL